MGKVIQSVRGMVQGTLNRKKIDTSDMNQPNENGGLDHVGDLDHVMDELEKAVANGMAKLKTAVKDDRALGASEVQRAEQAAEELRLTVSGLEAQLRAAEETVRRKEAASQRIEEGLRAELRDLQSALKEKEDTVEQRNFQITDLQSKTGKLTEQVGQLESDLEQSRRVAASDLQQAREVAEDLRGRIGTLEAGLRDAEEAIRAKEANSQRVEESLRAEIRDLQGTLKQKEDAVAQRNFQISDLQSQTDRLAEQATQLELAVEQAKKAGATEVQRAEQAAEELRATVSELEAQLREAEETVRRKEADSQRIVEGLRAELGEAQSALEQKEDALAERDFQITEFRSTSDRLTEQVSRLESAMEQAKRAAAVEGQHAAQIIEGLRAKIATLEARSRAEQTLGGSEAAIKALMHDRGRRVVDLNAESEHEANGNKKTAPLIAKAEPLPETKPHDNGKTVGASPAAARPQPARIASIGTDTARETVSSQAFDGIITQFSEFANVIKSIASLIVRHHVRALGESMEEFPQSRINELLESLCREISDDTLKASFRERFA
jgi:chromosome segregation ATPase